MIIRESNTDDLDYLVELRNQLWPYCSNEHRDELKEFMDGKSGSISIIFVAEMDSELVGFLELNIREYAEGSSADSVPYVEGWYVSPHRRRIGIGKALMLRAEQWASAGDFNELASDAELENIVSQNVHEKLGFVERERIVCYIKNIK